MARPLKPFFIVFACIVFGLAFPEDGLYAQGFTEFVVRPDSLDNVMIRRSSQMRINTFRSEIDRVVPEDEPETPVGPAPKPTFKPDPDADPRHKLDSANAVTPQQPDSGQTLIHLERTDIMLFDSDALPDIQVLSGNVVLRHDDAILYCDSAHLNRKTNSFFAFRNVRIDQGDSVNIFSQRLHYDGNTRIARLKYHVKLVNGEVTITTDSLTYDRNRNLGYYLCGGTVRDSLNTLVSDIGYYYSDTNVAEFKSNVFGYNDDNNIASDTLQYNTDTKVATILGPTLITHLSDSSTIYSEKGWYDTERDLSQLLKNSLITHSEGRTLRGDTIFYDKSRGLGEAFHNVVVTDTAKSIILSGHYGYFSDKNDQSLITDSALMREYSQSDTIYAHADTIYAYQLPDSSKVVNMYHNGRLYCVDFQAISDSLSYTSSDSVIHLRQMPVLWNENWQITGDSINIYPTNGELNRAHVIENAMIIQNHDTIHYNQMAGREFLAFIGNEQLDSLHIMGNARSIFFPEDKGQLIGLNKIESSYMTIYFNDGKLDRLKVFPQPVASMIPMAMITGDMLRLPNFTWQIDARPTSPADVFRHPQRISQAEITRQNEVIKEKQKEERRRSRKGRQEGVDEANPTTANGNGAAAKPMSASSAASAAKQRTD